MPPRDPDAPGSAAAGVKPGAAEPVRGGGRERRCANCSALLTGRYCAECGQSDLERPHSLWAFFGAALEDLIHLRSRTLRSLIDLVIRPGELTAAYYRGQRVRYTQPVQLYLIAAAIFFLANSYRPFLVITASNDVVSSLGSIAVGETIEPDRLAELAAAGVSPELFRERFQSSVRQSLPPFMLGSILIFALALAVSSPRRPALLHALFALHWTGFYLFIMSLERLVPGRPGVSGAVGVVLTVAALLHLIVALRRAYGHGWPRAVVSGACLMLAFNFILAAWVMAVVEFAHWQAVAG